MPKDTNYYTKLGVSPNASKEVIRKAYRKKLLKVHPDVNSDVGATELFISIQEAYKVLSNPTTKLAYDGQKDVSEVKHPVNIQSLYSCGALRRLYEPQLVYALIDIETTSTAKPITKKHPLNIALILDVSNSMQGVRINTLKTATLDILKKLGPRDSISVITFNDRAKVILSSQQRLRNKWMKSKVMGLIAKGGTEIYQGLESGFKEIEHNLEKNMIHHMILITDGHTYGDEEASLQLAQRAAKFDVGISGFGIGNKWNDKFLDELAALTGGVSTYIQSPQQINQLLDQKIRNFPKIYAKNVLFNIRTAPTVSFETALRLLPEVSPLPSTSLFSLGSLRYHTTQRILLEFLVDPLPTDINEVILANGEFAFRQGKNEYQIPITLRRSVVPADTKLDQPSPEIIQALSQFALSRMQEKAQEEAAQGNHQAAAQKMKALATHLLSKEEIDLGKTAIREAAHLEEHQRFSEEGPKKLKYGTRKLLMPPREKL